MAKTIICARHGRVPEFATAGGIHICMKNVADGATDPDGKAVSVPCGRKALTECAKCPHPEHPERKCSTILSNDPDGTKWCACGSAAK